MASVIFTSIADQDAVNIAIAELRRELGFSKYKEFRFSNDSARVCEAFCRKVRDYCFTVRAIVIEKTRVTDHHLRRSAPLFYKLATKLLLDHTITGLDHVRVVIDGLARRDITQQIREVFNTETRVVARVEFADSRSNSLIQLADMAVGGIARSFYPGKGNDFDCYRKLWHRRIEMIHEYESG